MDAFEMIRNKLTKDLDVLLKNKSLDLNMQNDRGDTLMHMAVRVYDLDMIDMLLSYHPNLELANNDGRTPLYLCVVLYSCLGDSVLIEIYEKLVNAGANDSYPTCYGDPLYELAEELKMIDDQ